mmetsp:Transcript_28540/g.62826  ORF Transcript_28540/g.62826 Transcript_28540/m.62826 type:complete len:582 (+) Transcript_28540:250-1995(+)
MSNNKDVPGGNHLSSPHGDTKYSAGGYASSSQPTDTQMDDVMAPGPVMQAIWAKLPESSDRGALRAVSKNTRQCVDSTVTVITLHLSLDMMHWYWVCRRPVALHRTFTSHLLHLTQLSAITVHSLQDERDIQQVIRAVNTACSQGAPGALDRIRVVRLGAMECDQPPGGTALLDTLSSSMRQLRSLTMTGFDLRRCAPLLARLTCLTELRLCQSALDKDIVPAVTQLSALHTLGLSSHAAASTHITHSRVFPALQQLTILRELQLGCSSSALHLSQLTCLTAFTELSSLDFSPSLITPDRRASVLHRGLDVLECMGALSRLSLPGLRLGDEGLGQLQQLPQLQSLLVADLSLTEACPPGGLPHLMEYRQKFSLRPVCLLRLQLQQGCCIKDLQCQQPAISVNCSQNHVPATQQGRQQVADALRTLLETHGQHPQPTSILLTGGDRQSSGHSPALLSALSPVGSTLTACTLKHMHGLTAAHMARLAATCPRLQTVCLGAACQVEAGALMPLLQLTQLAELHLECKPTGEGVEEEGVLAFIRQVKQRLVIDYMGDLVPGVLMSRWNELVVVRGLSGMMSSPDW